MKPLRPARSTLLPSHEGRWTSQSPPGKTSTAAPAPSASSACLCEAAIGPVAAQDAGRSARRARGCERAGRRGARPRSRWRRRAAARSPPGAMLPPVWLPTSSTGPFSGTLPMLRTSAAVPERRQQPRRAAGSRGCSRGRGRRGRRSARSARAWPRRRAASPAALRPAPSRPPPTRATAPPRGRRRAAPRRPSRPPPSPSRRASRRSASPARRASSGQPSAAIIRAAAIERRVRSARAPSAAARRGAGRLAATARSARGSGAFVCSGSSTCGTWPQSARTTCSALGSAAATWRAKPAGMIRSASPQTNSAGGSSAASRA